MMRASLLLFVIALAASLGDVQAHSCHECNMFVSHMSTLSGDVLTGFTHAHDMCNAIDKNYKEDCMSAMETHGFDEVVDLLLGDPDTLCDHVSECDSAYDVLFSQDPDLLAADGDSDSDSDSDSDDVEVVDASGDDDSADANAEDGDEDNADDEREPEARVVDQVHGDASSDDGEGDEGNNGDDDSDADEAALDTTASHHDTGAEEEEEEGEGRGEEDKEDNDNDGEEEEEEGQGPDASELARDAREAYLQLSASDRAHLASHLDQRAVAAARAQVQGVAQGADATPAEERPPILGRSADTIDPANYEKLRQQLMMNKMILLTARMGHMFNEERNNILEDMDDAVDSNEQASSGYAAVSRDPSAAASNKFIMDSPTPIEASDDGMVSALGNVQKVLYSSLSGPM
eukprot:TRINITY_DN199_c0_g1_i1.p1 TRINITY_DN199_c0_g1~~TRINITY_DN199_c0_g1_i1.p1  ORF type:complete len:404 (+),score=126.91 TRINITY_DN199_c0_g1_i1:223-1434(+)